MHLCSEKGALSDTSFWAMDLMVFTLKVIYQNVMTQEKKEEEYGRRIRGRGEKEDVEEMGVKESEEEAVERSGRGDGGEDGMF